MPYIVFEQIPKLQVTGWAGSFLSVAAVQLRASKLQIVRRNTESSKNNVGNLSRRQRDPARQEKEHNQTWSQCWWPNRVSLLNKNLKNTYAYLNSRVFLLRQLWMVNYFVKNLSNNLSYENINMLGTYPDAKGIPRVKRRNTTKLEANADGQIGCLLKVSRSRNKIVEL